MTEQAYKIIRTKIDVNEENLESCFEDHMKKVSEVLSKGYSIQSEFKNSHDFITTLINGV